MAQTDNQMDLFLLGKTGNGKSSTANSILNREAFQVSDGAESETYFVQVGWTRRNGRIIKVMDGPGVGETRLGRGDAAKKMCEDMQKGLIQCPEGFHALVLVLKYGSRFTAEELKVIISLKSLFGEDFVREYCVVIFTHGELFEMNNRKNPRPFSQWCAEQKGPMKDLLAECGNKVVLFYNMDESKSDSQLEELCSIVDKLKSKGKRYTNELFEKAGQEREKLIVRENAPQLRQAIQAQVDLLIEGVNAVKNATQLDDATKKKMDLLRKDAICLEVEIKTQDKGTGVLDSLLQVVQNIQHSVSNQEQALREKHNKEKSEAILEQVRKDHEESLRKLREAADKGKGGWCNIL